MLGADGALPYDEPMRRALGLALVGLLGGFLLGLDLIVLGIAKAGTSLIPTCALIGLVFGVMLGWLLHLRDQHPAPTPERPRTTDVHDNSEHGPIVVGGAAPARDWAERG